MPLVVGLGAIVAATASYSSPATAMCMVDLGSPMEFHGYEKLLLYPLSP
jgi:hypothetical protein